MTDCRACLVRPVSDATVCRACVELLVDDLDQVRWLVGQLEITLTHQGRAGTRAGGRSAERPLPYHLGASVDLETLRDGLTVWAGSVTVSRGLTPPTASDAASLADWMIRYVSDIAQTGDAAELIDDVSGMTAAALRTIDRAPDRRFVGPCDAQRATTDPAEPDGCGADLYAAVGAREARCHTDGCGAVYLIEERRAWLLEAAADQLRTARQLSQELPWIAGVSITAQRIGMWAVRGKLARYLPHPHDQAQAQRFRVGEVIEVARAMAEQEQVRRVQGAA